MLDIIVLKSLVAGIVASLACGLGALPLLIKKLDPKRHTGLGYALAGGLMFSASVYNLILPGLSVQNYEADLPGILTVVSGIFLGSLFLWGVTHRLGSQEFSSASLSKWGGKQGLLIFIAMAIHSVPEGVAVGVGYASGEVHDSSLGSYIALAIAIHNIPEGLAVAIPLRAAGASLSRCFWVAVLTSLPQPLAAVPASIVAWLFQPIITLLMGFAAGAMIFLVLMELLPDALSKEKPVAIAWAFTTGFCLMLLVQVVL